MKRPLSITARMTLLFALSASLVLMVAGVGFERALDARLLRRDVEELSGKMQLVRDIALSAHTPEGMRDARQRIGDLASGHPGIVISVRSANLPLFETGERSVARALESDATSAPAAPRIRPLEGKFYRFVALTVPRPQAQGGALRILIALDVSEDQEFVREIQRYLWLGVAQVAVVLGALGWIVVRHGLSPLRRVSGAVAAISSRRLDKPLEDVAVPGELRELVVAFNTMLARLHDAFRRLADFSSDMAHELRTPIQNLLMQTQVTLNGGDDVDAYRAVLQSNEEEFQRLSGMISDMLFLAKADNRKAVVRKEALDLRAEVADLFDFYEALAGEQGIELRQSGEAKVLADRNMLQRAISNLLSNAIRFTPRGEAITVTLDSRDGYANLAVSNPGPEIAPEHRERIFERLYRIDPSRRHGDSDNVGLGLAITKSVIDMHGGRIWVDSREGRVTFLLSLPLELAA